MAQHVIAIWCLEQLIFLCLIIWHKPNFIILSIHVSKDKLFRILLPWVSLYMLAVYVKNSVKNSKFRHKSCFESGNVQFELLSSSLSLLDFFLRKSLLDFRFINQGIISNRQCPSWRSLPFFAYVLPYLFHP